MSRSSFSHNGSQPYVKVVADGLPVQVWRGIPQSGGLGWVTYGSPRSRREAERLLFSLPGSAPTIPTNWRLSPMPFEVFMWSWDEISGRKVLATVPTKRKLTTSSTIGRFPHAYIDYRSVPE